MRYGNGNRSAICLTQLIQHETRIDNRFIADFIATFRSKIQWNRFEYGYPIPALRCKKPVDLSGKLYG